MQVSGRYDELLDEENPRQQSPDSYDSRTISRATTYYAVENSEFAETLPEDEYKSLVNDETVVEPKKDSRFYIVFTGMCIAWFAVGLDDTIVAAISAPIIEKFHDIEDIGWFTAAYLLPQASLSVSFGKLSTRINLRNGWLASTLTFLGGSLMCALANSGLVFIIGRAITGVGVAANTAVGLTLVSQITTKKERMTYIATIVGTSTLSTALGPLAGAVLIEKVSFRWCFLINMPIGIVSAAMVFFFLRPQPVPKSETSYLSWWETFLGFGIVGCVIMVAFTLSLMLGLQFVSQTNDWSSPKVVVCLVFAGIFLLLFFAEERYMRLDWVFVPPAVINRGAIMALSFGFLSILSNRILTFYLPFYFQAIRGFSPILGTVHSMPFLMVSGIFSLVAGALLTVCRYPNPLVLGGSFIMVIGGGMVQTFVDDTSILKASIYMVIAGIGSGIVVGIAIGLAQQHVPPSLAPLTLSIAFTVQLLGAAIGVTIGGTVVNSGMINNIQTSTLSDQLKGVALANVSDRGLLQQSLPTGVFNQVIHLFSLAVRNVLRLSLGAAILALVVTIHQKWIPRDGPVSVNVPKKE